METQDTSESPILLNCMVSVIKQWYAGAMLENLNLQELKEVIDYLKILPINRTMLLSPKAKELMSSMSEYLLKNKKFQETSKGRLFLCLTSSQSTKLLETLEAGLTLKEKGFYPFWDKSRKDIYDKLWLPLETDLVDSDLTFLNGSVSQMALKSWFSIQVQEAKNKNLQKTCSQSSMFSIAESMECEDTLSEAIRCRKLKLTKNSMNKTLDKINDHCRYIYNRTIWLLNETRDLNYTPSKYNEFRWLENGERNTSDYFGLLDKFEIRKIVMNGIEKDNLFEAPYDCQEGAVFEAVKNYKSAMTNLKQKNIKYFKMGFKSKKKKTWSFSIRRKLIILNSTEAILEGKLKTIKKYIKDDPCKNEIYDTIFNSCIEILNQPDCIDPIIGCHEDLTYLVSLFQVNRSEIMIKSVLIVLRDLLSIHPKIKSNKFMLFPSFTDKAVFETTQEIPDINMDSKIHFDGFDYWLLIPETKKNIDVTKKDFLISTDPGVRVFQTVYSPSGFLIRIGEKAAVRLRKIKTVINNLIYNCKKYKGKKNCKKKNKNNKKKVIKLRKKMLHLQSELHYKTANLLTKISSTICLPEFGVQKMTKKDKRVLGKRTVIEMLTLGHGKFKEWMKTKSSQNNCKLIITQEPYTTQTCGRCGILNKPGCSHVYNCKSCNLKIGRDDTAARNNLLCNIRHLLL